ncbi:MAG TPA: peptidoglycan-binding domain-containing protein, partial [Desulfuromonadaceae bacterium]
MSVFRLGSRGDEVRRIQQRLHTLGIYRGALDGVFGGATAAAVRNFQNSAGVASDGVVGPVTWKALFADDIPSPAIASMPLDYRCLALTGAFETGAAIPDCFSGLTGDCDGQGISLGVLQWNFGQGSLQPLLRRMVTDHGERCRAVFHEHCDLLAAVLAASKSQQMAFARSIQDLNRKTVNEPWRGMFRSLGRTAEFQRIQLDAAHSLYRAALKVSSE